MSGGTMAWWYWFGMWIAGITSLVITWWLFVDAYRTKGNSSRYVWSLIAGAGLLMQLPAFVVASSARSTTAGAAAAVAGVLGTVLMGIAAVSHFTVSGGRGGSNWSSHTRDQRTGTSDQSIDRRRREPARATVPISKSRGSGPSKGAAAVPPDSSVNGTNSDSAENPAGPAVAPNAFIDLQSDPGATEVEEPDSVTPSGPTITIDRDETLVDEVELTVVDEPAMTQLQEDEVEDDETEKGPQLVVTGGTSSRIIVTERTGPFRVGRDPSKANLAVDDGRVSRVHFVIDRMEDKFMLNDYGSSNGTFVNGSAILEPRELENGDVIEFGRTIATFVVPERAR